MPEQQNAETVANPSSAIDSRVPALDGVRGFAILLVLAFHFDAYLPHVGLWGYPHLLAGMMWVGVDLFFVLSGYLITGILLDTRDRPRYYRNFYIRRALRIFPLYYVAVLLLLIARRVSPAASDLLGSGSLLPAATYVQNVVMSLPGGLERVPAATYHFWSLALEEQFYLFWPFFILRLERGRLANACVGIVIGCLLLRTALWFQGTDPRVLYFLTPTRIDAFAAGAFVSAALRSPGLAARVRRAAPAATVLGTVAIFALFKRFGYNPMDTEGAPVWVSTVDYTLLAMTFAGLVAWCTQPGALARAASTPVLRFFGHYSYGLYVFHPVAGLCVARLANDLGALRGASPASRGLAIVIAATLLSILAAKVSWVLIESPFLALKRRFPSGGKVDAHSDRASSLAPASTGAPARRESA